MPTVIVSYYYFYLQFIGDSADSEYFIGKRGEILSVDWVQLDIITNVCMCMCVRVTVSGYVCTHISKYHFLIDGAVLICIQII